ncbi:uncharacterized protein LY89DRAFT_723069 [Mollisia scopiformis]|uniref:Uncharacterized protein n=1 Tax=Mollisia scopiformis TaxID=149040 RepID=A0A194WTE3_MOLSC|nr:uncharacterized protein LY89DRAFT_723069 [Mollisia scopiformis]KUJ11233.1 hypothetical protein LY89DRAFT_723069 [Mollisia scopiformis]
MASQDLASGQSWHDNVAGWIKAKEEATADTQRFTRTLKRQRSDDDVSSALVSVLNRVNIEAEGDVKVKLEEEDSKVPCDSLDYSKLVYPKTLIRRKNRAGPFAEQFMTPALFASILDRHNRRYKFTINQYHCAWEYAVEKEWPRGKLDMKNFNDSYSTWDEVSRQDQLDKEKLMIMTSIQDKDILTFDDRLKRSQNNFEKKYKRFVERGDMQQAAILSNRLANKFRRLGRELDSEIVARPASKRVKLDH